MKKVLITGGSGLVGSRLSWHLQHLGYAVAHLSHSKKTSTLYPTYYWDPKQLYLEPEALHGVDFIVHLAGANVGEKRWSEARKKEILESRTQSGACLLHALQKQTHQVKHIICASATGYYPQTVESTIYKEDDTPGSGFLYDVVNAWESAAKAFQSLNIPTTIMRIGVVLSTRGGALPKLMQPIKYFAGAPLGTGRQQLPWIHIDDLCRAITWFIDKSITGTFNLAAPNPVSNAQATHQLAELLHRKIWLPNVPEWTIKLLFGEMSVLVLKGCAASPEKLLSTGFKFIHNQFSPAVRDLLAKNI